MNTFHLILLLLLTFPVWPVQSMPREAAIELDSLPYSAEKSVVKVFNFSQQPEWQSPWKFGRIQRGTGTGFLVEGNYIMTNAHVVSWSRQILVKKQGDPRPYRAELAYAGHDCDLAVLKVLDNAFYKGMQPLKIGDLPVVRSSVTTYGYPAGGEQISYTLGVVSRIEMQAYAHSGNRGFLVVQTDAAINPGNSGGPVIQDGKVVGVAFQGLSQLENTGFFIPPPVVRHFLEDIADGKYNGFPVPGFVMVALENPAYRDFLGLADNGIGARVDRVMQNTPAPGFLEKDDVVLSISGYEVGSDAAVDYKNNRVHAAVLLDDVQDGEYVNLTVLRQGEKTEINLPLKTVTFDQNQGNQYDTLPPYYIQAGLVFTPLSLDYLKEFGRNWMQKAPQELVHALYFKNEEEGHDPDQQAIILSDVLPHSVNSGIRSGKGRLVKAINGKPIGSLQDVIDAFEIPNPKSGVDCVEFAPRNQTECFDRSIANHAHKDILELYDIPEDKRL